MLATERLAALTFGTAFRIAADVMVVASLTAAIVTALAGAVKGKRLVALPIGEYVDGSNASIRFEHVARADLTLRSARIELG